MKTLHYFFTGFLLIMIWSCSASKKQAGSMNASLYNNRWKIVAINGAEVDTAKIYRKDGLSFNKASSRFSGTVSCNSMTGKFEIGHNNTISFSQVAITKMMCMDMSVEDSFLEILDKVTNFELTGKELKFTDGTEELARFEPI
ncbi:hypothetical protein COR50_15985 [Chitinophaga caeni]|uniref:DUF306 domain-containing protein n=1 Tax=Chitinophaga caeni TaxID=2029983 RepID=A0A291QX75_9BACT|nr:META domain-containing protein [Chitinophaga caeni]ATL48540.1 hypothetical protein COR50_15985 [Chitinophaga caeni]